MSLKTVFIVSCLIQRPPVSLFLCLQTVRHGFPHQPTSLAFDPVQKILAIGSRTGGIRMYPSTPHLVLTSPATSLHLHPPLHPLLPLSLPSCGGITVMLGPRVLLLSRFLLRKPESGSKFPPAHRPVALLQLISRSHHTPHLHPAPFHPSCCTVTPPNWVFMLLTHN